ncbi:aspartic peptidase domain-containing protein [Gorgonomyces haynaldii]|nr:aspartic peptidase domain-containing protein [Gorgonomyces haynaldii]
MNVQFGTPAQTLPLEIETGFSGLWVMSNPCPPGISCNMTKLLQFGERAFRFNTSSTFLATGNTFYYTSSADPEPMQCLNVSDSVTVGSMNVSRQSFGLRFNLNFGTHGKLGLAIPEKGKSEITNAIVNSNTPVVTLEIPSVAPEGGRRAWVLRIMTAKADQRSISRPTMLKVDTTSLITYIPDELLDVIVPKSIRIDKYPDMLGVDCNKVMKMPPLELAFETGTLTLNWDQLVWQPSQYANCISIFASNNLQGMTKPLVLGVSFLSQFKTHFDLNSGRTGFEESTIKNPFVMPNSAIKMSVLGVILTLLLSV